MQFARKMGQTVVTAHGVKHVYALACPRKGNDYQEQIEDAFNILQDSFNGANIVHQTVFLRDLGQADVVERYLRKLYGQNMPATSYVNQTPCDGRLVGIEAMGIGGNTTVEYHGPRLTTYSHDGLTWAQTAHAVATTRWALASVYNQSMYALWQTKNLLESVGTRFDQVVRTWLYVGDIVAGEGDTQRYKELNRARTDFFGGVNFLNDVTPEDIKNRTVYPASTGISTAGKDICMASLALRTNRFDVAAVPLENPRQTAACDYGTCYSPQSPKFSRAMAVTYGGRANTYVSGTASITKSETQHANNAARQTEETLDNIATLIGEDNFGAHGLPGFGTNLDGMGVLRAYIKYPEDYFAVREVCENRLNAPVVYTIGDVCRQDLLVEIEGIAHSYRPAMELAAAA